MKNIRKSVLAAWLAVMVLCTALPIYAAPICAHVYGKAYDLEPTCTEEGILRFSCTKCTYSYTENVEPIGHTNDTAWIADEAKETMWHKCVRCEHTSEPRPYVAPLSEEIGFHYEDGEVSLNGEWTMKAGANYYDAFPSIFDREFNLQKESVQVLRERFQMIKDYNIPYIRFNALGYAREPIELFVQYPDVYYAYMDFFIQLAAEYEIGLIPSLFWQPEDYPNYFDEPGSAFSDRDSETCRFIHDATDEFLTRYLNHPNIWGWELGNEYNLGADNPGEDMTLANARDSRIYFAEIVRELDPYRIISSGDAIPSPFSWSIDSRGVVEVDSYEDAQNLMDYLVPEELDTFSIHFYDGERDTSDRWYDGDSMADVIRAWKTLADERDVAFFAGEYGSHIAGYTTRWEPDPPSYESILKSAEIVNRVVPEVLNACAEAGVALSFYWGLWSYPSWGIPENVITPDSLGSFVLDYLKAYNDAWDTAVAGDLDGNGTFNNKDVTRALRKLANPSGVTCDEMKMDTSGDGEFTSADAIVMMRALAGWDNVIVKHYVKIDFVEFDPAS